MELLGAGDLVGIAGIDQHADVEVAVADVADDRRRQAMLGDVAPAPPTMQSASAEIGTHTSVVMPAAPGPQRPRGVVGAVAGVPQAAALALVGGPGEVAAPELGGDLGRLARLGGDVRFGAAVELEEQGRGDRERRLRRGG